MHQPLLPDSVYHLYNHANGRHGYGDDNLFRSEENYRYFLQKYAELGTYSPPFSGGSKISYSPPGSGGSKISYSPPGSGGAGGGLPGYQPPRPSDTPPLQGGEFRNYDPLFGNGSVGGKPLSSFTVVPT